MWPAKGKTACAPLAALLAAVWVPACGSESTDRCAGVICDDPPADSCLGAERLQAFRSPGACDPATGQCSYVFDERHCEFGCADGLCKASPDTSVWGWVSVLELGDAQLNADWGWMDGVRAHFAAEPYCRRALDFDQPGICCSPLQTIGACTLYEHPFEDSWRCEPACDWDRQECVTEDDTDFCRDLPWAFDIGELQLTAPGLDITLVADELGRYASASALPADLFAAGDPISAASSGGELDAFELACQGVAPLELADTQVELRRDQSAILAWTPADPGSRVRVLIASGPHHPAPPAVSIVCEADDEAGQVEIGAELVNGFLDLTWVLNRFSHAGRYRRCVEQPFQQEIGLVAGSLRHLDVIWQH
ncbi:MAG: hypothetical protein JXR96_26610 [Deltaproteobacteria bacterium]|nr:hypothetical protein [Deltaproteobacteria bacterium]